MGLNLSKRIQVLFFLLVLNVVYFYPVYSVASEVKTEKSADGWRLLVDGKPFFIKGMCYTPSAIGESADDGSVRNWMSVDNDRDGRNDFAYQSWVDSNRNNTMDPDEKAIGDFELMRQMGVNVIRVYHHLSLDPELQRLNTFTAKMHNYSEDFTVDKERVLLRDLYSRYHISVAMGDLLGAYTVSTGAGWAEGTDYSNPQQRANMLKSVEEMVRRYKDEPYILMWILGNENNLQGNTHTNASQNPEVYARFVNEAAVLIKKIDGHHPVAISNGADFLLEDFAKYAPDVDIFGLNKYSVGGFGELWNRVSAVYDRPVMLTEFGQQKLFFSDGQFSESVQERIHQLSWKDIALHAAGKQSPGNAIGGFVYEWVDEWWKDGEPAKQNLNSDRNAWDHEYSGVVSMGDGSGGSLERQIRSVYGMYKEIWKVDPAVTDYKDSQK